MDIDTNNSDINNINNNSGDINTDNAGHSSAPEHHSDAPPAPDVNNSHQDNYGQNQQYNKPYNKYKNKPYGQKNPNYKNYPNKDKRDNYNKYTDHNQDRYQDRSQDKYQDKKQYNPYHKNSEEQERTIFTGCPRKDYCVSSAKYAQNTKPEMSVYAEIQFKSGRRKLYKNDNKILLREDDNVIVELETGCDFGTVSSCGTIADDKFRTQYKSEQPKLSIIRKANHEDLSITRQNSMEEIKVIEKSKELVHNFKLDMKVTNAEWQFDRQRLTIYFTAPQRIDFRELVKELARSFKTRIELRQISTREEAKRIGGMGPCGRHLCCSSFINEFCHVTLDHARTQQLSNNVAKLSGYCGRLKCCLLYEFDNYVEAFKKYPHLNSTIELPEGKARIMKVDIFKDTISLVLEGVNNYKNITFEELEKLNKEGKVIPPPRGEGHFPPTDIYFEDDVDLQALQEEEVY